MENKQRLFKVMEWHRGEFIPLKTTNSDGTKGADKVVKITEESAEMLNADFSEKRGQGLKIKYILADEKPKKEKKETLGDDSTKKDLQAIYSELSGKRPYHAWTVEELTEKINELKQNQ